MTELTYEVPTVGEKHQASDQRVGTALTEIKTVLNGRLTAGNFAKETITPKKFAEAGFPLGTLFNSSGPLAAIGTGESFTETRSQNTAVTLTLETAEGGATALINVGSTLVATLSTSKAIGVPIGSLRVPAGESYTIEVTVGKVSGGRVRIQAPIA